MNQEGQSNQEVGNNEARNQGQSLISRYNKNLIIHYVTKARVTSIFLITIWVVFLVEWIMTWTGQNSKHYGVSNISPAVLIKLGGNVPIFVKEGQIYRLFTATILHAGMLHILMNTMSLLAFCAFVEPVFTQKLYWIVYIIGGIQGNMLTDFYNLRFGSHNMVGIGASTSICAIMGLYIANIFILYQKNENVQQAKKRIISMLLSLLLVSLLPGVDFFGHFGSLISGFLWGLTLIPGSDKQLTKTKKGGMCLVGMYSIFLLTIFI